MTSAYAIGAATVLGSLAMLAWRPGAPWSRALPGDGAGAGSASPAPLAQWTHGFVREGTDALAGSSPGGFHHAYAVRVRAADVGAEAACMASVEWAMPRDVFVDAWMLARLSPYVRWETEGNALPDLEAPAYSESAQPFVLKATVDLQPNSADGTRAAQITVPDVCARYQQARAPPGRVIAGHIPPPAVAVRCDGMAVQTHGTSARPLEVSVPVAAPSLLVAQATYAAVVLACAYVFVSLLRF